MRSPYAIAALGFALGVALGPLFPTIAWGLAVILVALGAV